MKKIVAVFICLFVFVQPVFAQKKERCMTSPYQFQITPDDKEWETFTTTDEMIKAYQIPTSTLEKMTTNALVETILENPFLIQYMVYENTEDALDVHFKYFNIYNELFSRNDVLETLSDLYEKEQVVDSSEVEPDVFLE